MHGSENYLLAKSAEKLGTPVKMELDKLRQVAEERAANCNKGLAGVLGISSPGTAISICSSPISQIRSDATVISGAACPMSAVSFKPGMSVYRPGRSSTTTEQEHCPPTPSFNEGKRSRLSYSESNENRDLSNVSDLKSRFNEALSAAAAESSIPFSPARASSQGINLVERETCPNKLASRQKQIDYGKNTTGYCLYTAQVPKNHRKRGDHPWTPNKFQMCSKRSWDGQVRKWRRALHKFDPNDEPNCEDSIETESIKESSRLDLENEGN